MVGPLDDFVDGGEAIGRAHWRCRHMSWPDRRWAADEGKPDRFHLLRDQVGTGQLRVARQRKDTITFDLIDLEGQPHHLDDASYQICSDRRTMIDMRVH